MIPTEWITRELNLRESPAPILIGLISALRPIKRLSSQLSDEATLLRRFSYKNKNQHNAARWWKHLIQVDRIISRTGTELEGLLTEFGWSVASKEDSTSVIGAEAVVQGLLRLPRSSLLLDKSLSVLMGAAGILEPLIQSRAFLAFALVVVAIVARLHALCTVLSLEMDSLRSLLDRLVLSNKLSSTYESQLKFLPRMTRKVSTISQPHLDPPTLQSTTSNPPPLSSFFPISDDLGSILTRPQRRTTTPSQSKRNPSLLIPSEGEPRLLEPHSIPTINSSISILKPSLLNSSPQHLVVPQTILNYQLETPTSLPLRLKRTTSDLKDSTDEVTGINKKKKKKKKEKTGDEIDDIFG